MTKSSSKCDAHGWMVFRRVFFRGEMKHTLGQGETPPIGTTKCQNDFSRKFELMRTFDGCKFFIQSDTYGVDFWHFSNRVLLSQNLDFFNFFKSENLRKFLVEPLKSCNDPCGVDVLELGQWNWRLNDANRCKERKMTVSIHPHPLFKIPKRPEKNLARQHENLFYRRQAFDVCYK